MPDKELPIPLSREDRDPSRGTLTIIGAITEDQIQRLRQALETAVNIVKNPSEGEKEKAGTILRIEGITKESRMSLAQIFGILQEVFPRGVRDPDPGGESGRFYI